MNVFSALRFPLQVAGTVFDTLITAEAVNRHAQSLAAMWEPKQDWEVALTDLKAEIESFEPGAPYLQWGGPETWPQRTYCNACGAGYTGGHKCLRVQSSPVVPPTATGDRPAGVVADPPSAPPAGHPLFTTSLLLEQGAVYAEVLAGMETDEDVAEWHRIDAAAMRERADAFKAVENTT